MSLVDRIADIEAELRRGGLSEESLREVDDLRQRVKRLEREVFGNSKEDEDAESDDEDEDPVPQKKPPSQSRHKHVQIHPDCWEDEEMTFVIMMPGAKKGKVATRWWDGHEFVGVGHKPREYYSIEDAEDAIDGMRFKGDPPNLVIKPAV